MKYSFSLSLLALFSLHSLALENSRFESPELATDQFAVFPREAGWSFDPSDGSGVTGTRSPLTAGNPFADKSQVAFIINHGAISQKVFLEKGDYVVGFSSSQRLNYQAGTQTIVAYLDDVPRGSFAPPSGEMAYYATTRFPVPYDGVHVLTLRGEGSGADYTAFIDDVSVFRTDPVRIDTDVRDWDVACAPALATFETDFTPAKDLYRAGLWVRHLDGINGHIVSERSWYDASVNTLVDSDKTGCSHGPFSTPTEPFDSLAESTFQMTGDEVGILVLSSDARDSTNPHVFYGIPEFGSRHIRPWQHDGDTLEVEGDMRMTMWNALHVSDRIDPVGQLYLAVNATDPYGKVMEMSISAYDSRPTGGTPACDLLVVAEDGNAIVSMTFDQRSIDCPHKKYVTVPYDPSGRIDMFHGDSGPNFGAWYDWRTFRALLTKEGLKMAIDESIARIGGFDPDPAHYSLTAVGMIQEMIWFDPRDAVDMATSLRRLHAYVYSAR